MPRFCVEVAGAGLARPGGLGQGTSDLRVMRCYEGARGLQARAASSKLPQTDKGKGGSHGDSSDPRDGV